MSTEEFHSAFYVGQLGHRRFSPKYHDFSYEVCMCYIDLDEWTILKKRSVFWSDKRWALACFSRKDFLDGKAGDLKTAVKEKVRELTGEANIDRVCMLTNLRYFGIIMNPLTIYYCFDSEGKLCNLLLEVTNTPWNERHFYALNCEGSGNKTHAQIKKAFHVSPFNPMEQHYDWGSTVPGERLSVEMKSYNSSSPSEQSQNIFSAALSLQRKPMTRKTMNYFIVRYPFMTLKVWAAIYWQATKLFFKGVKYYHHPKPRNISTSGS